MTSATSEFETTLRRLCREAGAVAVGFARAGDVSAEFNAEFEEWLRQGCHAGMDYMERHAEIRRNPAMLLKGAETVVCLAFSYHQPSLRDESLPLLAPYAYGRDYHKELRTRLRDVTDWIARQHHQSRICIDSAPLPERYWAMVAGIGRRCDNGSIAVDGHGTELFLAEIITTMPLHPDTPSHEECLHCGECHTACPTKALSSDGRIDSRRCLNYLTIEHSGLYSDYENSLMREAREKHPAGWIAGCDICQRACPLNHDVPATNIPNFLPRPGIMSLTPEIFNHMAPDRKEHLLAGSALRRSIFFRNKGDTVPTTPHVEKML